MRKTCLCLAIITILLLGLIPCAAAESPLDSYATGSFGNQQSLAVYTGPGEEYFRANNGKAAYGGGSARIYGVAGDWIMIGYGLSNGNYRIGYISGSAMKALNNLKGSINYNLTFQDIPAWADNYCRLTDDPVMNNKMIYTIPEGTQVKVLATMGTAWTYVEVDTPSGPMRGFVWSIHLMNASGQMLTYTPAPTFSSVVYAGPTVYTAPTPQPTALPSLDANMYYHDTVKGEWLPAYQEFNLKGNWPVYSGPGDYYYRANNGKALMGGGSCRIYGAENGWVLIGYGLSNGNYRIGYISAQALNGTDLRVPYLDLRYTTRRLSADADLTDDTLRFRPTVAALKAGSYVLFLGYAQDAGITWAYVEVLADNSIMRGFIPASALE